MIKKARYKLMITKHAKASRINMLYDLEADRYKTTYLSRHKRSDAVIVGKAHHLKCLLLEWM